MVDRIPTGSSIPQMFEAAMADGSVSSAEAQAIYSRIISNGVRPEEIASVQGIVDALRTGATSDPAMGSILNAALGQASTERGNTSAMASSILSHIQSWSTAIAEPMPMIGPDANMQAYYTGVIERVASRYPHTPDGVRRLMSDLAHVVSDHFPPGNLSRADALAAAYSAVCDRFFEHNGAALDYSRVAGHRGSSTDPQWADLFRLDGLSEHGRPDGVYDTDCKGFALVGEYFFREAGVPASAFHYADVIGADVMRSPPHRVAYVEIDGHTVGMSNGDAELLDGGARGLPAFAARQTNRPYSTALSEHTAPATSPTRR